MSDHARIADNLVEDEFTNRPDDDELAFLHYERLTTCIYDHRRPRPKDSPTFKVAY